MNSKSEVLESAADMVDRGWCRHSYAKDRMGVRTAANGPYATRWCASGAVITAALRAGMKPSRIREIENGLTDELFVTQRDPTRNGVDHWNDHVAKGKDEVAGFLRETAVKWREADRRSP